MRDIRGERVISVRYLAGDVDINFGAETKTEPVRLELEKGDLS